MNKYKSQMGWVKVNQSLYQYTEVCFASFLSGGFITAIVVNLPERKLAKRTSVRCFVTKIVLTYCTEVRFSSFFSGGFITATVVNPP